MNILRRFLLKLLDSHLSPISRYATQRIGELRTYVGIPDTNDVIQENIVGKTATLSGTLSTDDASTVSMTTSALEVAHALAANQLSANSATFTGSVVSTDLSTVGTGINDTKFLLTNGTDLGTLLKTHVAPKTHCSYCSYCGYCSYCSQCVDTRCACDCGDNNN